MDRITNVSFWKVCRSDIHNFMSHVYAFWYSFLLCMIIRGTVVCVCSLFFSHQIELSQMVICLQNGWWQTWMCRSCWIIRTNILWIVFLSCSYKHMADTGWWCWWTNHSWSCRPYISCRTYYAFPSSKSVRTIRTAQCHMCFMLIALNLFTVLVWN